ncbi:MAG TPA: Holliday junction ATP-dependent DNA helicase RuvA [Phycisphaerae bacterium]|nr:Holliday junction ATP-dependent DNA helicase RuvA [Phycisphaerae bacterium]HSA25621.1 Holliday junction ATP-dependent DNA helicase RuvA [Phycisphaerae bacterium]
MIVRITGIVLEAREDSCVLDRDGIGYEILLSGHTAGELLAAKGQEVTLLTLEYYEGSSAGGNLIPRIIGFLREEERAFFGQFIKVKGMGMRRAIKALDMPPGRIAAAIEAGDANTLAKLPGVGKRVAQQIIAELKGKVGEFALGSVPEGEASAPAVEMWTPEMRDALQVLVALGERHADAQRWLERARQLHPDTAGCDEWIRRAYQVRSTTAG